MQREVDLPVSLHLCAPKGTKLADITTVVSHPNPLGQTRVWMAKHLPDAVPGGRQLHRRGRAAGGEVAQEGHGVDRHAAGREARRASRCSPARSRTTPRTRPASCSSATASPRRRGHDKTSVVCFQRQDRPGLAARDPPGVRGARDQPHASSSRGPPSASLGDYCFFIDFEGHVDDELVADCLRNLDAKQAQVKFLGSYPVAGDDGHVRRRAATKAWRDASRVARRPARAGARRRRRNRAVIDLAPPARRARATAPASSASASPTACSTTCSRPTPSAASAARRGRGAAGAAERGVEGDRQGGARRAPGQDRRRERAQGASSPRSSPSSPRSTSACASSRSQVPNPADASVPDGGEDDGEVLRVVGDTVDGAAARPRRVRRRDGLRRHRARPSR